MSEDDFFMTIKLKTMIQTNPNPKMTPAEIQNFRKTIEKCVLKKFTYQEKKTIQNRIKRINQTAERVLNNNGGKNPILGY